LFLVSYIYGDGMSQKKRLVLLNALPLNAIQSDFFVITCKKVPLSVVVELIKSSDNVDNYIRHESTVKLLSRLSGKELKPSSGLYKHEDFDVLEIVTLKRPIRGQEVEVTEEDLEAYTCIVTQKQGVSELSKLVEALEVHG
jgi:hypothetical protein